MNLSIDIPQLSDSSILNDLSQVEILSRHGAYAAGIEERKLLCLLSDGRLLIAQGQEANPHVRSYCARMERLRRTYQRQLVGIDLIARAYRDGGSGLPGAVNDSSRQQQTHSMMQITAKDMLTKACQARASDIHIRVRKMGTEIYYRIHNDLNRVGAQTREYGERLLATLYAAMTSVSDSSYKPSERQDASIADRDKLPPGLYGVRIATAPTSEGSVMVLRLLYNDAGDNVDLRPLGFNHTQTRQLQMLKEQPIGMNIISGPTGSGKSTTLQRVLTGEILEAEGKLHVLTVEDPVEYPIAGAVQTAVTNASNEEDRSRMFSAAIANAMRLDPDTIMIGEVRDRASAQNALRASMTGHQVWTTVHANSALSIVDRLADLGLPLSMVADHTVVTGLISQRLVKLLCSHCKVPLLSQPQLLSDAMMGRVRQVIGVDLGNVCVAGAGCPHCKGDGTVGRTVVAEVIIPDARFFEYLRAGEKNAAYQHWREKLDGRTLLEHAIEKIAEGLIDPRMAEKVVGHLHNGTLSSAANLSVVEVARAS
jgi:general secretion pathway protein E